ncbi:MAG: (deoxy)nucleoside triphosphate pyrophosphohydrolase [Nitrospiria bacterium]
MSSCRDKHIHVTCAIIEMNGLVLATQRSAIMDLALKWEFPGGKIKPGESPEICLRREILEELDVRISVLQSLKQTTHNYPEVIVTLYPFVCEIDSGEINLTEHTAMTWLPPDKLYELDWAEADIPILAAYCHQLKK